MLNLLLPNGSSGQLPRVSELLELVEGYSAITGTSVDACLAEAVAEWLMATAADRVKDILVEMEARKYLDS